MVYPQFEICEEEFNNPNPQLITTGQTSGCLLLAKWLWEYETEFILAGVTLTGFVTGAYTISRLLILGVEPEDSLALTIEQPSASSCFGKGLWEYEIEYILGTSATGTELVIDGGMTAQ